MPAGGVVAWHDPEAVAPREGRIPAADSRDREDLGATGFTTAAAEPYVSVTCHPSGDNTVTHQLKRSPHLLNITCFHTAIW